MTKNKESTRYFSDIHEKSVCKLLNAQQQSGSGSGKFRKGDVVQKEASLLIECKTVLSDKASISIKKIGLKRTIKKSFLKDFQVVSLPLILVQISLTTL